MEFEEIKKEDHIRLSIQVFTPIFGYLLIHLTCRMKLRKRHCRMLHYFYLKGNKRETKTHERESAFIEGNGAISILVVYYFILGETQDSPIRRITHLYKIVI